ncbi:MAG: UDP-glucose dehydrogenase (Ugd-2) [Candidatus Nomurabacteria bacterium GW2011_GWB1_35_20]|uniref:UDP-glucose dehydrogenase (Ugd-2) n=3 Tax=Candidatus Nomuraibacteriota TaxID=1752729 RepID=A0A0G0DV37_9BACT|nr:MAG: UDP-glucose dehydrogenase (Ugd-2) [Candidatus Nomurabacteria bacterium GW2011_GWB1_35_20]KKP75593.1 MAG: UDP-glucose dehydrogenase (Ugd-2) [Parcubacteria group bacterium GW2011_GWC1_35_21]KKP78344.1 MAG: UDP-glucose dehydrogenase (Ugd-2) [Candidatus Nomurabacteria bacterium GW2011_GWC2_35_35]KKP85287.1 MAG: UDP-glucose dehydrogenase (Ugd-2) [Parcubacteria group bacterium GW2011_GWD2_35_7]KKP88668.1 MAG: UDP-glucose dehydrogenase (Ugd-2) [Candidatus Nomurabacteria bacterium GW2011_GWA2_3
MAKLIIIGSGIVGRATGGGFIAGGHEVVFCDINLEVLAKLQNQGHKVCSPNLLEQETNVKAFFLAISTPTVDNKIKLDFLESAVASLGEGALKKCNDYCIVVIRSTVPPNTIESTLIPLLEKYSGKKAGKDFGVCMNPEYLRENSNEEDFKNPWIIVIGELDIKSGKVLDEIYGPRDCPIIHTSIKEAEAQKYIHNLFNACKISFFNEMRMVCEAIKVDTDKVFELVAQSAEGSWNQKYGIRNFGPYGGSCLPKDTTAFLAWAKDKLGKSLPLLKAVIRVNEIIKEKRSNGSG